MHGKIIGTEKATKIQIQKKHLPVVYMSTLSYLDMSKLDMVEPSGIEPLTSTLPVLRSPS